MAIRADLQELRTGDGAFMKPLSERPLLLLLAAVQFTHIMDFMILMPLGPQLMRELHIGPGHFSALVAAYTISSDVVGLLAAPFIDPFDRRKVLLLALERWRVRISKNAATLLATRALSGAFGGLLSCACRQFANIWKTAARNERSQNCCATQTPVARCYSWWRWCLAISRSSRCFRPTWFPT